MKIDFLLSLAITLYSVCIILDQALAHSADSSRHASPTVPTVPSQRSKAYSALTWNKHKQVKQQHALIDMVIATSLDGSIRGIGRYNGRCYWTIRGGSQASLVKSNAHYKSRLVQDSLPQPHLISDIVMDDSEDTEEMDYSVDGSINSGNNYFEQYHSNNNAPLLSDSVKYDHEKSVGFHIKNRPEDYNISYIIEPTNGGILYLQTDGEPLQQLPFTMKNIVDRSFVTEDGVIYIGEKSTLMIALDPLAGRILRKFDLRDTQYELRMNTKGKLPPHTIYLGRNEYNVHISDHKKNMFWRLTYSEYEPNAMNWNIPKDTEEASDIYIAPDANRGITGINLTTGEFLWTHDLPYPVVTVFDVYQNPDYSLLLSKQIPPAEFSKGVMGELINSLNSDQSPSAYVSVHEGTLYALSSKYYPLIQLAEGSFIKDQKFPGGTLRLIDSGNMDIDNQALYKVDRLIGRNRVELSIIPPSQDKSLTWPGYSHHNAITHSPSHNDTDDNMHKSEYFYERIGQHWKLCIILLLTAVYFNRKRGWPLYTIYLLPMWKILTSQNLNENQRQPDHTGVKQDASNHKAATVNATEVFSSTNDDNNTSLSIPKNSSTASTSMRSSRSIQTDSDQLVSTLSQTIRNGTDLDLSDDIPHSVSSETIGLDLQAFKPTKSSILNISDTVLGYGSHGTVVYKGTFDGRAVAVKRLLIDFYDVAFQEVKLLQESDDHPNVIRYFYKEETDRFLYIALELCFGSLQDCMDRSLTINDMKLYNQVDPANILFQITNGIQHLHSLKIVHRDLKPQNILLAPAKHQHNKNNPSLRILISDFGLCKKLDGDQSSFHYTAASPAGTSGWRAPELLAGALAASVSDNTSFSNTSSTGGNGKDADPNRIGKVKATRAIDIFSAGCIFYYVLSNGDHPFGNRYGRESNILKGDYNISALEHMGEDGMEAMDLIDSMLNVNPKSRPTADKVLAHPFFWSTSKRLSFLQDASDRFEVEQRDPPSILLQNLEKDAKSIVGYDWYRRIDRVVANDLGKFRKYDGKRVRDLLRALRNKKHHWQDLPEPVKRTLGEPPDQYLYYFTARFPRLLLHTYHIIANNESLTHEGALRQYF